MLGGGGFTGGVYEIGALGARPAAPTNRSVDGFDVFVGTSAGSLVAAPAANGVTPEQMMQVINDATNVMDDAERTEIARYGLRSVTLKVAEDYEALRDVAQRHGTTSALLRQSAGGAD